jgi:hypothetical protein
MREADDPGAFQPGQRRAHGLGASGTVSRNVRQFSDSMDRKRILKPAIAKDLARQRAENG